MMWPDDRKGPIMRRDEPHNGRDGAARRQAARIVEGARPELAPYLAAILSSAEGGLIHLDGPNPDLAAIRDLLGDIALAGRRAAVASGQSSVAGEARAFGRARQDWTTTPDASPEGPTRSLRPERAGGAEPVLRGGLSRWQQKQALSLMTKIDPEPPGIAEVAAACRLSRGYFIKAFKQTFGQTPRRWHKLYRIEHSKHLLLSQDLPIAEIALACGFADQSHLTRVFNQIVGAPPARWRRQSYG